LINRLLRNQIVRGGTNLGQSTEKPVIVEALDLTFRTIEKRIKRYRYVVISVVIVSGASVLPAIFYRQWLFAAGLILLVPLVGGFSVIDSRCVRQWRTQILDMSRARNLDLQLYIKTASELRKISPRILQNMLTTIPSSPRTERSQQQTPDRFDKVQRELEKKTIIGIVLLSAAIVSGAGAVAFYSGALLLLTVALIVSLALLRR
jgi:hypothetical protein